MSSENGVTSSVPAERLMGRVKWFNNKAGYGFITVTDGPRSGSDVFVHHSSIQVSNQQYKYLVQGEYLSFDLVKATSGSHEWNASNVNGVNGGKLMCETRREFKLARSAYRTEHKQPQDAATPAPVSETKQPRQKRVQKDNEQKDGEWKTVKPQNAPKNRGRPRKVTSNQNA